jgi:DNA repair protein RadC
MTTTLLRDARITYGYPNARPTTITGPEVAAAYFRELIGNDARETFITIWCDGRHQVIGHQIVSIGIATASLVHARETFQAPLHAGTCALILAHNHPSGHPKPSEEDKEVCKRLALAGEFLGIRVLDFLTVTHDSHRSMRDDNPHLFDRLKEAVQLFIAP